MKNTKMMRFYLRRLTLWFYHGITKKWRKVCDFSTCSVTDWALPPPTRNYSTQPIWPVATSLPAVQALPLPLRFLAQHTALQHD